MPPKIVWHAAWPAEISTSGYDRMTMSWVAARAGSSKESLYVWFGSKQDMVAELIRRQSASANALVELAMASGHPPRQVLIGLAHGLLALLTSPVSLALNRAAMTSPELASALLTHGRHTTGPKVERYFAELCQQGVLALDDVNDSFSLFYGLVVRDTQIRTLLGEPPPSSPEMERRATASVDAFVTLAGGTAGA